ncbi:MAG TPA: glycosyltransferase [Flavitalea sp.]|nr:glycosyltransferase [Flavitalea sp.]
MTQLIDKSIALIIPEFNSGGEEKRVAFFVNNYLNYFKNVFLIAPEGLSHRLVSRDVKQIRISIRNPFNLLKILQFIKRNNIDFFQGHKRATLPYLFAAEKFTKAVCIFNYDNIYLSGNRLCSLITPKNVIYLSDILKSYYKPYYRHHNNITINMGGEFYDIYCPLKKKEGRHNLGVREELVLVNVGRLVSQKNHILFIQALRQISDRKFKAFIVGDGPLKLRLKNLIDESSLEDKVVLLGFREDIGHILNISDVMVQSSLFEGFPNTFIEAASVGLPIVATKVGSSGSIVKDNGVLVSSNDSKELAEAIAHVIDHYDQYKHNALQFSKSEYLQQFKKERMLDNYIKYYQSIARF